MAIFAKPEEKYKIIEEMISNDNNLLNIVWLCEIAEVSRSGYYAWRNRKAQREEKERKDQEDFEVILEAYNYRGVDKGARTIYMRLLHSGVIMNIKKIRRLMKKYRLTCQIRKANPYRRMMKALQSDTVAENILDRQFRTFGPRMVLLTDITYLFYGNKRKKAYLSVIKDAYTSEVLGYQVSKSLEVDFVLKTIEQLIEHHGDEINRNETMIHSDQGSHYTSIEFRQLISDKAIRQSMSRRGNCWDNAPQESFFGHMKDEIKIKDCHTFETLKQVIDNYMDYYNHERYQWNLAKLAPSQYYTYVTTGKHPLMGCSFRNSL